MTVKKQLVEEVPQKHRKEPPRQKSYLSKEGRELPNPTPMAPPLGFKPSEPLHEQIRRMVRSEALAQAAAAAGAETLEEADDFNVGDDFDPTSPYEYNFDPPTQVHPDTMDAEARAEYDAWRQHQFDEWRNFRKAVKETRERIEADRNEEDHHPPTKGHNTPGDGGEGGVLPKGRGSATPPPPPGGLSRLLGPKR